MAERERYQPKHGGGRGSRGLTRTVRRIITVLVVLLLLAGIVFLVSKLVHKGGGKTEKTTKPKQTTTEEVTLGPNDVAAEARFCRRVMSSSTRCCLMLPQTATAVTVLISITAQLRMRFQLRIMRL